MREIVGTDIQDICPLGMMCILPMDIAFKVLEELNRMMKSCWGHIPFSPSQITQKMTFPAGSATLAANSVVRKRSPKQL